MTTRRTASKTKKKGKLKPRVSRPAIQGYGIPEGKQGLLPWSHVSERMANAQHYWICTVSPDRQPHATPVDGLWLENHLYFSGSPATRRNRNLAENSAVSVHLGDTSDVVILNGDAEELKLVSRSVAERLAEAHAKKYGYGFKPEDFQAGWHVFQPRLVLSWKEFPKDATRWQFEED
jgi:nitroimidazol reductase NimA-like FMN-containing flavoprotein (pyridoxamine 5'-phosphate oxidase superfamily)